MSKYPTIRDIITVIKADLENVPDDNPCPRVGSCADYYTQNRCKCGLGRRAWRLGTVTISCRNDYLSVANLIKRLETYKAPRQFRMPPSIPRWNKKAAMLSALDQQQDEMV